MKYLNKGVLACLFGCLSLVSRAQENKGLDYVGKQGTWYFSWGYNEEWFTNTDIHIRQPSLGNNYSFKNVIAQDKVGWDHELLHTPLSIPQYNYRLGHWFKDDWGIEINFDHTKYEVDSNQELHMKGTFEGRPVDSFFVNRNSLTYYLNNGANFFLFNLVHRVQIPRLRFKEFNTSFLWKAGVGFMYPHTQNTIFGKSNNQGFQFGGLDAGVEGDLRFTFFKYVYLKYCNKLIFTDYWGLHVYEGTASQHFGTYEMIANLGVSLPLGHPDRRKAKS